MRCILTTNGIMHANVYDSQKRVGGFTVKVPPYPFLDSALATEEHYIDFACVALC